MRFLFACSIAAALVSTTAIAEAQTMMTGSCTKPNLFNANLGVSVPTSKGLQSVSMGFANTVFGNAECVCNPAIDSGQAINLQMQITTAFPAGTVGQSHFFIGANCQLDAQRSSTPKVCQEFFPPGIDFFTFVTGSSPATGFINVPIPANPLFSSTASQNDCTANNASSVWVLLVPSGTTNDDGALCSLQFAATNIGPPGVSPSALPGDSAVTVNWTQPPTSNGQTNSFQILCADNQGQPIPGLLSATQAYSICVDGTIKRRNNFQSGSVGTTDDGGVSSAVDLGTTSQPLDDNLGTLATDDMGTDNPDLLNVTTITNQAFATSLDPRFICSDEIKLSGANYSRRIGGLNNGSTFQFVVLAIDIYGNATPSGVATATPQAVEDLYNRYRHDGGGGSGFCFIATAAWGSYENRYVHVLRDFRDDVLLQTEAGQSFVDWYYAHSPPLAAYIADHRAARIGTQLVLWPVIAVAAAIVYTTAWQKALFFVLLFAFAFRRELLRRA
jgi:hypothetical protein